MSKEIYYKVKVPGKFHGQVAKLLEEKLERNRTWSYRLATKWDEKDYPAWFGREEIEKVSPPPANA